MACFAAFTTNRRAISLETSQQAALPSTQTPLDKNAQRAQSARVEELEKRVSATLHAAFERSKRIGELEAIVDKGRQRDQRIKELEVAMDKCAREATARAEHIKDLEDAIAKQRESDDPAASAVLQDAMTFADQMLSSREELVVDSRSVLQLRESVDQIRRVQPKVEAPVAELINRLVTALRWPLALRQRLAKAEQEVKEHRAIQDAKEKETHSKLDSIKEDHEAATRERDLANEQVFKLQSYLDEAKNAVDEAVEKQRKILEKEHTTELRKLQQRQAAVEVKLKIAEMQATEYRDKLAASEKALEDSKQTAELENSNAKELESYQQQLGDAEENRKKAEALVEDLMKQLNEAKSATDVAALKNDLMLEEAQRKELIALKKQEDIANIVSAAVAQSQQEGQPSDFAEPAPTTDEPKQIDPSLEKLNQERARAAELERKLAEVQNQGPAGASCKVEDPSPVAPVHPGKSDALKEEAVPGSMDPKVFNKKQEKKISATSKKWQGK